ncbi:MAG: glycerophosphodiester phosphodiesterase [Aureliella sp.]
MLREASETFRRSWKSLVLADLMFKAVSVAVLAPLASVMFHLLLSLSGRSILADTDILNFAIHPLGLLGFAVLAVAGISIFVLEQAVLMTIALADRRGQKIRARTSVAFALKRALGILRIAFRVVIRLALRSLPFLLMGGGIYLAMLTEHDINYYLSAKPPKFWIAVSLIGVVFIAMFFFVGSRLLRWLIAFQLYVFHRVEPHECLDQSQKRLAGNDRRLLVWLMGWFIANALAASMLTGLTIFLTKWLVPVTTDSLLSLATLLGLAFILWVLCNGVINLLSVVSLALIQTEIYSRWGGKEEDVVLPSASEIESLGWELTLGRTVAVILIVGLSATLLGVYTVYSTEIKDNVTVIAHRGASAYAPENTLASVARAIEDQTDFVEIDVQESSDGIVIVAHDSDLKKVSGRTGKIWDATAAELREVDIGSYFASEFSAERVPTLAEVLSMCRGKAKVNIELKYYGHDQDLERRVIQIVEDQQMVDQVVLMSLEASKVKKFKGLRPDMTVGLLTAVAVGGLEKAEADFLAVNTKLATKAFIASAHRAGKKVAVWTVNDPSTMSVMISRGVDSLITDDPALAKQVIQQRSELSPVQRLLITLGEQSGVVSLRSVAQ